MVMILSGKSHYSCLAKKVVTSQDPTFCTEKRHLDDL
jgi:hypothetical protein